MAKKTLQIEFGIINGDNVEQLRKVNTACFPVSYNEKFYQDVVERNDIGLNKYAYWNGFVVGAVCTRLEPLDTACNGIDHGNESHSNHSNHIIITSSSNGSTNGGKGKYRLYIMTLGVLAAYRGRGIGTQLIQSVLDHVAEHNQQPHNQIDQVALHVQISNQDAIRFYTTRFGFVQGEMVENYYRRIEPPHCYLLYKNI